MLYAKHRLTVGSKNDPWWANGKESTIKAGDMDSAPGQRIEISGVWGEITPEFYNYWAHAPQSESTCHNEISHMKPWRSCVQKQKSDTVK